MDKNNNDFFNNNKAYENLLSDALMELGLKDFLSKNNKDSSVNSSYIFFKEILDSIPSGIGLYQIEENVKPLYVNEAMRELFGYVRNEDGISTQVKKVLSFDEDLKKVRIHVDQAIKNNETVESTFRVKNPDNSVSFYLIKGKYVGLYNNLPAIISIIVDVTKEVEFENDLKYRLAFDSVTDIYNKDEFYRKTEEIILNNPDKKYDLISLNIDRFKLINDIFGMDEGDKLLKYFASILSKELDFTYETCGRLYADNFAICKVREEGYEEKLLETLSKNLSLYPLELNISFCFGIYRLDTKNISVVSMCDRANMALKKIKGNYKKRYAYYEEFHRNVLLEEQEIINDMYDALKEGQFEVYFQPKYFLSNTKLTGAEALVRWKHPKKGMIPPDKFIPLFEKTGFITSMDEYVWEFTCKKIKEWLDLGLPVVPISVNVSRVDIYNPKLCENLFSLLKKYNIPTNMLELEITETAYTENPTQLISAVHELKKLGFTVEMDDFGTGYSSLNMLNQVPVDVLKLDLRFLKPSKVYGRGANILNSVVSMAKWLNLPVVAEGIETKEQVAFLRSIGCNKGQGFYFSKPMPHEEFEELLKATSKTDVFNDNEISKFFIDLDELWDPNSQINILFDSFVGGLGVFELKGDFFHILRVNDRFYEIMDLYREDIYNMSPHLMDYIIKPDRTKLIKKLREAKMTNGEVIVESRFINPLTRQLMYIVFRLKVILNNSERTLFLGSVDNFTDEKIAQNNLKSSEERYEIASELTEDIVFEYDYITSKIKVTNNFKKKFGKIPEKTTWLKSIIDSKISQKKDIEEFASMIRKLKYKHETTVSGKFYLKNTNNLYSWCVVSAKGIYDKKNNLTKIVGVISDVDALQKRLMS